jgi:hypothetical protein
MAHRRAQSGAFRPVPGLPFAFFGVSSPLFATGSPRDDATPT